MATALFDFSDEDDDELLLPTDECKSWTTTRCLISA
jgi:hypothetical protein